MRVPGPSMSTLNEATGTRHDVGRAVAALKNLKIAELVRNDTADNDDGAKEERELAD